MRRDRSNRDDENDEQDAAGNPRDKLLLRSVRFLPRNAGLGLRYCAHGRRIRKERADERGCVENRGADESRDLRDCRFGNRLRRLGNLVGDLARASPRFHEIGLGCVQSLPLVCQSRTKGDQLVELGPDVTDPLTPFGTNEPALVFG